MVETPSAPAATARMTFYGLEYEVDLERVRRRMVQLDTLSIEDPRDPNQTNVPRARGIKGHAEAIGMSHMTLRRFFAGAQISLTCLNLILSHFGLKFEQVCSAPAARVAA